MCCCTVVSSMGTGMVSVAGVWVQMELGGKDVCIICEDADLDLAAKNIIKGGFSYSGQRCTAVKLILVVESVADKLVGMVSKQVDGLSVGKPEVSHRCSSMRAACSNPTY